MKLPEDRKERMQILVLGALVTATLLYVIVHFGVWGMFDARHAHRDRIAELDTRIREAENLRARAAGSPQQYRETLEEIQAHAQRHLLQPRLGGNLLIGASEQVAPWFEAMDMPMPEIREIGRTESQGRRGPRERQQVWSYAVALTFRCGFHELTRLLEIVENSDPCVTVSHVSVRADSPAPPDQLPQHPVSVRVEWPIWRDDDMWARVPQKLENAP